MKLLLTTTLGQRLAAARRAAGMTQMQLATHLGVHLGTICQWERGGRKVSVERVKDLAAALAVNQLELIGE